MNTRTLSVALTVTGAALCWWPAMVEPSIGFPALDSLTAHALTTVLSTALSAGRWFRFVVASTAGSFAGLCVGSALFPPSDPIADSYVPYSIVVATAAAFIVALVAALVARKFSLIGANHRRAAWVGLACCVAFGPALAAVTPALVAHRVAHDDRIAAERFNALKGAVERTVAQAGNAGRPCDRTALQRNYSGPSFSNEDWQRITGNYVTQEGYLFMVYCREQGGYTIDARPFEGNAYGTRQFCTDESGKIGCRMEWNRSRHACIACAK